MAATVSQSSGPKSSIRRLSGRAVGTGTYLERWSLTLAKRYEQATQTRLAYVRAAMADGTTVENGRTIPACAMIEEKAVRHAVQALRPAAIGDTCTLGHAVRRGIAAPKTTPEAPPCSGRAKTPAAGPRDSPAMTMPSGRGCCRCSCVATASAAATPSQSWSCTTRPGRRSPRAPHPPTRCRRSACGP